MNATPVAPHLSRAADQPRIAEIIAKNRVQLRRRRQAALRHHRTGERIRRDFRHVGGRRRRLPGEVRRVHELPRAHGARRHPREALLVPPGGGAVPRAGPVGVLRRRRLLQGGAGLRDPVRDSEGLRRQD